jgi:hypothetical protein
MVIFHIFHKQAAGFNSNMAFQTAISSQRRTDLPIAESLHQGLANELSTITINNHH